VLGEIEMLVLRKLLVGKDHHRVLGERVLDGLHVGWVERPRQVDVADFGGEGRRHRNDGNGHGGASTLGRPAAPN
jgi:hypothetical protein